MSTFSPSTVGELKAGSAAHLRDPLLLALAAANPASFEKLAGDFIKRWAKALGASTVSISSDGPVTEFKTLWSGLYLHGFEDPHALLLPTFAYPTRTGLLETLRRFASGDPPLLLCLSEAYYEEVVALLPKGRAVALHPDTSEAVLAGDPISSREVLRTAIREQIPLLRLQPYDTTRPVAGEMFVGRSHELNLLRNQARDSFLISGPSKIGKTSLLQHYRWTLVRESDPKVARSFYVNLQPCSGLGDNEIARYVAVSFRDVPYTHGNLVLSELRSFLFSVVANSGGPVEIILDEADAVCHTTLLIIIAEFAAASRSRLIAVGRGKVRKFHRSHYATAFGRLRELRFQALDAESAWALFRRPIEALGLKIDSPELTKATLLRQSSRMPHLVQGCARSVIEFASESGVNVITPPMLRRSHDPFLQFGVLRTHLDDLQSPLSRLAAIEVLEGFREGVFTVERIRLALKKHGAEATTSEVSDLCDDLVTNCLLGWDRTGYGPARWDVYETAQHHRDYLCALRRESLAKVSLAR